MFVEFGCQKVSDSFFDLVMVIANLNNEKVFFVAAHEFTNNYEVKRIGQDCKD